MKITAPFGYGTVVPLRKDHRVLMHSGATPAFCRTLNAIAVSIAEFTTAARDYPIVFASLDGGASYAPVLVLGLQPGQNLFVDSTGEWHRGAYVPAFVRRYPFCLSKLYVDGEPRGERVVCVAAEYVDAEGIALFDEAGRPTPRWQSAERLLSEFEADLDRTASFCAALARLRLFEPFAVEIGAGALPASDPAQPRLGGMYRVSHARLAELKPASHKALVQKGFMGHIYAHLHSLEGFSRLAGRLRGDGAG